MSGRKRGYGGIIGRGKLKEGLTGSLVIKGSEPFNEQSSFVGWLGTHLAGGNEGTVVGLCSTDAYLICFMSS